MLTKDSFSVGNVIAIPCAGRVDKAKVLSVQVEEGTVTLEIITSPDKGDVVTNSIDVYLTLGNSLGAYVEQGETNA